MKRIEDCFFKVKNDYLKFLNKEKIFGKTKVVNLKNLKNFYIPLSLWIENKYKKKGKTLFLGFSGGQGSGKTTITGILTIILKKYFQRKVLKISIDDFYKTLKERAKMAKEIHPLFKTRGVPGTHDIDLIIKLFNNIEKKNFERFKLPKFAKNLDDRLQKKFWYNIKKRPEIVIIEGWCVGAKPQSNKLIKKPVNILEKNEDKNLKWRKNVNKNLKKKYKKVFQMIDQFIFLQVPKFL